MDKPYRASVIYWPNDGKIEVVPPQCKTVILYSLITLSLPKFANGGYSLDFKNSVIVGIKEGLDEFENNGSKATNYLQHAQVKLMEDMDDYDVTVERVKRVRISSSEDIEWAKGQLRDILFHEMLEELITNKDEKKFD